MYIKESLSLISVFVTLTSLRPITLKYNTKITLVNNIYKFSLSLFRKIFLLFECVEESLSLISVFVTLTSLRQITFTQNITQKITRVYTFSFSFLQNIFFRCRCNGKSLSFISWFVTLTSLRPITFTLGCLSLPLSVFRQDDLLLVAISLSQSLSFSLHFGSLIKCPGYTSLNLRVSRWRRIYTVERSSAEFHLPANSPRDATLAFTLSTYSGSGSQARFFHSRLRFLPLRHLTFRKAALRILQYSFSEKDQ